MRSVGKINIVPQDIGRVLLNLFNNAFYAVNVQKSKNLNSYSNQLFLLAPGNLEIVCLLPLVTTETVFPKRSGIKYFNLSSLPNQQGKEPDWD